MAGEGLEELQVWRNGRRKGWLMQQRPGHATRSRLRLQATHGEHHTELLGPLAPKHPLGLPSRPFPGPNDHPPRQPRARQPPQSGSEPPASKAHACARPEQSQ